MSTKRMKPIAGLPGPRSQVKVDLRDAETIKCKECNNYLFIISYVLKKLSALVSPTGQEGLIPIQVYSCGNCGNVAEGMLDGIGFEEEKTDGFPTLDV